MKKYEYLDHTADLKVRAYGKTLEQAFVNIAIGGFDFLTDTNKIEKKIKKEISISANRIESLLYDYLEELLFVLDTEGFIIAEIKDLKITEEKTSEHSSKMNISEDKKNKKFSLQCSALGDKDEKYEIKGNIKSVTYSDMKIEQTKDGFVIEVVLDI